METVHLDTDVSAWSTADGVFRALVGLPPLLMVLSLCWYYWHFRRILAVARKMPTAIPTLPVIGHLHYTLLSFTDLIMTMIRAAKYCIANGTKSICMWMGPYPIFFVFSHQDIHTVITSPKTSEKSGEYEFLRFALGNGLVTAPSPIHRITRRHINPVFLPRNLEKLMSIFNQSSRILVRNLSRFVGAGQFNCLPVVTAVALRNVTCVTLGPDVEINIETDEFKGLVHAVESIAEMEVKRFFKVWLWPDALFRLLCRKEIKDIKGCWNKFARGQLKALEIKNKNKKEEYIDVNLNVLLKRKEETGTPLSLPEAYAVMQQNYPEFIEEDLLNDILTLLVAGTDSSKCFVSACLLCLAANPDIQERLYQEIVSVAGAEESELTAKDISSMTYLDMVLRETLRKYSIIPAIMRKVREDLELTDCTLPAGGTVFVGLLASNFDPEIFPDPEKFDPERFSTENFAKLDKHALMPFSAGSRNCIGKNYAMMFAKTSVVHVLRRYRLSSTMDIDNLRFCMALALVSHDGYWLQMEERR